MLSLATLTALSRAAAPPECVSWIERCDDHVAASGLEQHRFLRIGFERALFGDRAVQVTGELLVSGDGQPNIARKYLELSPDAERGVITFVTFDPVRAAGDAVLREVLREVLEVSPETFARVDRALGEVPSDSRVLHLGYAAPSSVRLCVMGDGAGHALCLERLGFSAASFLGLWDAFDGPDLVRTVQLELSDDVVRRVGIEIAAHPELPPSTALAAWSRLFATLRALGLAHDTLTDQMLRWPEATPADADLAAAGWLVRRAISHCKLDLGAAGVIGAKGYLTLAAASERPDAQIEAADPELA